MKSVIKNTLIKGELAKAGHKAQYILFLSGSCQYYNTLFRYRVTDKYHRAGNHNSILGHCNFQLEFVQ